MKVELLVNLKIASGKILSRGTIFSDENGPIPEFIMKRIRRGMAKVIDTRPSPERVKPIAKAPVVEEPKEEKAPEEVKEESSEKPAEPSEAEPEPAEPKVVRKPSKIKAKKKIR